MQRTPFPPEARRLRRALYEDQESDAPGTRPLRGLPLRDGITESFFADLVVSCLFNYIKRAEKFEKQDQRIHRRLLNTKGIREIQKSAKHWPFAAVHADRALELQQAWHHHHQEFLAWEKGMSRALDPILCLWVLFRYLVRPEHGNGIEFYMKNYFPRILTAAGLRPPKSLRWTAANVERTFRRKGGTRNANLIAVLLLSTDARLRPYRPPVPSKYLAPGPPDPELALSLTGRALFRLPPPSKSASAKPSRGGQHANVKR